MTNRKRKLHHTLTLIRHFNYLTLLILCLFFAFISIVALRNNNKQMIKLRSAVFTADKNNGNIEQALRNLRQYVYAHMNTDLASGANAVRPPIQLKYEYERLNAANTAAYQTETTKVLDDAQNICVAQYPGSVFSQPRLECAKAYAAAHPITLRTIPDDLFKFDFLSPPWSPDLAGWSLVASGLCLFLFVLRLLSTLAIKRELRSNN